MRQVLVVVQFAISTVLMISVFVISNQLEFMSRHDKGIDMKNVIIVQAPIAKDTTWSIKRKTVELFKKKSEELPFVTHVASSTTACRSRHEESFGSVWREQASKRRVILAATP